MTKGKNSYVIELEEGGELERHRHQIRDDKAHEKYREIEIVNQESENDDTGAEEIVMSQEDEIGQETNETDDYTDAYNDDTVPLPYQIQVQESPVRPTEELGQGRCHTRANPSRPVPLLSWNF